MSAYKDLTIEEVRAMMSAAEIFDDIHESLAVRQYGQEVAAKAKQEGRIGGKIGGKIEGKIGSAVAMLKAGIPLEQVASILNLAPSAIEEASRQ